MTSHPIIQTTELKPVPGTQVINPPFTTALGVTLNGICGTHWPYRGTSLGERHEAVDLRVQANREKVWEFPEVKASPYLGNVILALNDDSAGLFTIGCHRRTCPNPQCRIHVNVCVSSTQPDIFGTWEATLQRLGMPLAKYMAASTWEGIHKSVTISVVPYVIHAEGPDFRWMLIVESVDQTPDVLQRAAELLTAITRNDTEVTAPAV